MQVDYVFTAAGHITTPRINHVIMHAGNNDIAIEEAKKIAVQLERAGYFVFDLYAISDDNQYIKICEIGVTSLQPVVTVKHA